MSPDSKKKLQVVAGTGLLLSFVAVILISGQDDANEGNTELAIKDRFNSRVRSQGTSQEEEPRGFTGNPEERIRQAKDHFTKKYVTLLNGPQSADKEDELEALARDFVKLVGLREALVHMESVTGSGENQNQLCESFFKHAKESKDELATAARALGSSSLRTHAWGGIATGIFLEDSLDLKTLHILIPPPKEFPDILNNVLTNLFRWKDTRDTGEKSMNDPRTILRQAYPDDKTYTENLAKLLNSIDSSRPFEIWRFYESDILNNTELSKKVTPGLLSCMMQENPREGISVVIGMMQRNPELISPKLFGEYVSNYIRRDSDEAAQWLLKNKEQLTPDVLNTARNEFIASAVRSGETAAVESWVSQIEGTEAKNQSLVRIVDLMANRDLNEARIWIERISDPHAKQQAEGKVWGKERELIRSMVNQDPTSTLDSFIEGTSKHSTYWIEEAMMTWISKEPEKAEEWYQKNWDSLPAAKSQFVAAAYANEAVKTGDLATARQWSNLIQDPKTKERIAASIDKAQSTQGQ